jgi:hypothetical protein
MKVVINESQFLKLLVENKSNEIERSLSGSKKFARELASDVKKQYKLDVGLLLTWGTVVGGFVQPISKYMEGKYTNLSNQDITLILFGIALTYFSDNKKLLGQVLDIIKDKKLITFFLQAKRKADELKNAFISFLESLNITFSRVANMLAYSFFIPLTPLIHDIVTFDLTEDQVSLIAKAVAHYTAISVSSTMVEKIVRGMIKRFRSKV